jgi:uncharacterized membrane protein YciS (DUF1049 family)
MTFFVSLISGIIIILGIIIGTQNGNTLVTFHLLKWKFEDISLTLLLIESLLFGIVIAVIVAGINQIKLRLQMRALKTKNRSLEKEIKAIKNMPFEEVEEEEEEEYVKEEKEEEYLQEKEEGEESE